MKSAIIIQKVHKRVRLLETDAGEAHASTARPGGGSSEGAKKGVGILCAEWRKEETEELTAWFHLSLARGHAEPVVAQNGVCSAVR